MLTVLSFLAAASLSFAATDMEPKNFCYRNCSEAQQRIWSAFEAAEYRSPEAAIVYSGECFHLGRSYDNTHAHHAAFYMSEVDGQMHASGIFAFYAKENPYSRMTPEEAEAKFNKHRLESRSLQMLTKSTFLDLSSPETPVRYWFRHGEEHVYLIGEWGLFHQIFCELRAN